MKTFTQCDYVNRLERLLGLIRITICLCNYTLSTGNVGHYPTAPMALDAHNQRRRADGQPPGDSLTVQQVQVQPKNKNCKLFARKQELRRVTVDLWGVFNSLDRRRGTPQSSPTGLFLIVRWFRLSRFCSGISLGTISTYGESEIGSILSSGGK